MSIKNETSTRIDMLRFPLIVGVVFIHCYQITMTMAQGSIGTAHSAAWADSVRFFISQGVARVAVPLFFLISGYLFFQGQWSWGKYGSKLRRRADTLLVPFLFWNVLALVLYSAGRSIPQTRIFFAGGAWPPPGPFSISSSLGSLFGINVHQPLCYQFWFIRDLMVLVLLAFVIQFLLRIKLALPALIVLFGLWLASAWTPTVWPFLYPSEDAAFFFVFGAYLAQPGRDLNSLDRFGPWIGAAFLGFLIYSSAIPASPLYLRKYIIIFGVPCLWWLTGVASRFAKLKSILESLSGDSFFVFAAHEPLQTILRKILYKLLSPTSGAATLFLYFLVPVFVIAFLVMVHRFMQRAMPRFTGMITGSSTRIGTLKA